MGSAKGMLIHCLVSHLQLVLEKIFLVRQFTVEAEELLLFFGQRLPHVLDDQFCEQLRLVGPTYTYVHFVFLMGIHDGGRCGR